MIDIDLMSFLDFAHFDFPGSGGRSLAADLSHVASAHRRRDLRLFLQVESGSGGIPDLREYYGCQCRGSQKIMDRSRARSRSCIEAQIRLTTRPSGEAIQALFAAECDLAVISRELEVEERSAAARGGLELEGYRFAKDAVVVIVNRAIQWRTWPWTT
jgi:hypothetical protein